MVACTAERRGTPPAKSVSFVAMPSGVTSNA
jgi:hypothetical protein